MIQRNARKLANKNSQVYSTKITQASQSETFSTNNHVHHTLKDIDSNTDFKAFPLTISPRDLCTPQLNNPEVDEIVSKKGFAKSKNSLN